MGSTLAGNWEVALVGAVAGSVLGVLALAALYLAPLARLVLTRRSLDGEDRARVLQAEVGRLNRLLDAAAVLEEHGRSSEAGELRAEIEFRTLLLALGAAWAARRENPF